MRTACFSGRLGGGEGAGGVARGMSATPTPCGCGQIPGGGALQHTPPVNRQTPVKILPCLKLRLRTVKMRSLFRVSSWFTIPSCTVGVQLAAKLTQSHVSHHTYTIWTMNCIILAIAHRRLNLFQNVEKCKNGCYCRPQQ